MKYLYKSSGAVVRRCSVKKSVAVTLRHFSDIFVKKLQICKNTLFYRTHPVAAYELFKAQNSCFYKNLEAHWNLGIPSKNSIYQQFSCFLTDLFMFTKETADGKFHFSYSVIRKCGSYPALFFGRFCKVISNFLAKCTIFPSFFKQKGMTLLIERVVKTSKRTTEQFLYHQTSPKVFEICH